MVKYFTLSFCSVFEFFRHIEMLPSPKTVPETVF